MTDSKIVAGYDGSGGAKQAIAWAAREARSRGSALTVCLAQSPAYLAAPAAARDGEVRRAAQEALAPGVQLARDLMVDGEVRSVVAAEPPARALCEQSADAEMVVVGCKAAAECLVSRWDRSASRLLRRRGDASW